MKYIEIYCDECRQDLLVNRDIISATNRYLILGGIWINSDFKEEFKNEIKLLREKYSVYGYSLICNMCYLFIIFFSFL